MTDYLGNEISIEDVVVFSERGSHGYLGSFSNGKVSAYKERREEISIVDNEGYVINKKAKNVIDLTTLGIRPNVEQSIKEKEEDVNAT